MRAARCWPPSSCASACRTPPPSRRRTPGVASRLGMGLHAGLVVVGGLGQAPQQLATVVGAPLHIASRLQQQAASGTILLSAATYELVRAEVRAEPYGTLTMDGQPTPMAVYAVQGPLRRHAGVAGRGPRAVSPLSDGSASWRCSRSTWRWHAAGAGAGGGPRRRSRHGQDPTCDGILPPGPGGPGGSV